jgi:hypothetical protein
MMAAALNAIVSDAAVLRTATKVWGDHCTGGGGGRDWIGCGRA